MDCLEFAKSSTETLYVYFDETGGLKFSPSSSKYYILTALWTYNPLCITRDLVECRYGFLAQGRDIQQFHANPNPHPVRVEVYGRLEKHTCVKTAAVVVEKGKLNPVLYSTTEFYPKFMEYVLKFALLGEVSREYTSAIIISDLPPTKAIGKAVKKTVLENYPHYFRKGSRGYFFQHPSMSNSCLQAVDYVGWALGRKWERGEDYWRDKIKHLFDKDELDIFERSSKMYYQVGSP